MKIIYNNLWKLMIDKGLNKSELREITGIGTNTLAKLSKNQPVSMEVLMKVCEKLDCDLTDRIKMQTSLMEVALDCLGLARAAVVFGEILLFILRQELRADNMHSAIHPRFYKKVGQNDRCPCGSGLKYKKCCRNDIVEMKPIK